MKKIESLGQFLLSLLHFYELEHIYGVDGDAVIRIRKELEIFGKITNVTCAHEATASFSAEVYGRVKKLGCLYVTYNAGINNALNGIDEGYLHNSALVVLGGEPSLKFRGTNPCLHHHQLRFGEFDDQQRLLAVKLGSDRAKSITNLATAAEDITVLVSKAVKDRLPVYIGMPSDIWDKEISYDETEIEKIKSVYGNDNSPAESYSATVDKMLEMLEQKIADMKDPLISIGHAIKEFGLLPQVIEFAEKYNIPVVARFNGFGAFPADHRLFIGVYNGPASVPAYVREFTENTIDRIDIGILETDLNFALQTDTVKLPRAAIAFDLNNGSVVVGDVSHVDFNVDAQALLLKYLVQKHEQARAISGQKTQISFESWIQERDEKWKLLQRDRSNEDAIRVEDIAPILNSFLKDNEMPIVSDVGDAMFIALGILPSLPSRITYTSNFAAMGAFAGCIGLEHAASRRPLALVGDGAFCMGETHSFALTNARPVIIILNNGGWSMMRQLRPGGSVIEGADPLIWPQTIDFHADYTVKTPRDFENALEQALKTDKAFIIDLHLDKDDKSEPLKNFKDPKR